MTTARMLWMDGLPLAPQHLQEADRLHHEALDGRFRITHGDGAWGIRLLALDPQALRDGVVRVARFEGVFADGTVVRLGEGSELVVPDRPIDGLGPERAEVSVHIALVRDRRTRSDLRGAVPRLRVLERRGVDTHTETPAEPVTLELGVPTLRIVMGHEPREDLETLPLGVARRDAHGATTLDETCVGPLLSIGASGPLLARLSRLVERLGARLAALVATRHERDAESVQVDPGDVTRFFLASALASHHPVLRHLLRRADAPPEALHERLLALAGALSVLAVDASIELPDFEPREPQRALTATMDRIDALLAATDREQARAIPLEPRSDGLHFARLDEQAARGERYYLSVRSVLPARDVESSLVGLAKVASFADIARVLETATPGAPLQLVHRPPPEVPMRAGETCFELPADDRHFRAALAERGIAVYLPARSFDPSHTRLTLVAIARAGWDRKTDRAERALHA